MRRANQAPRTLPPWALYVGLAASGVALAACSVSGTTKPNASTSAKYASPAATAPVSIDASSIPSLLPSTLPSTSESSPVSLVPSEVKTFIPIHGESKAFRFVMSEIGQLSVKCADLSNTTGKVHASVEGPMANSVEQEYFNASQPADCVTDWIETSEGERFGEVYVSEGDGYVPGQNGNPSNLEGDVDFAFSVGASGDPDRIDIFQSTNGTQIPTLSLAPNSVPTATQWQVINSSVAAVTDSIASARPLAA